MKDASLHLPAPGLETAPRWQALAQRLKHLLGVDRAIAFTVLARGIQILGSTGTVLLILRFLTLVEQGYYYTLLSLVSLQVIFELGFSFVILQMAAHECAHLTLHADGRIEGDARAHARLASILQRAFRWYLVAAVILCVSLLPIGAYFFSRHAQAMTPVAWKGPWMVAVFATSFLFLLNPFFSFLEGCGLVWQVGRMRFGQALLGAAMSWGALISHHGLYSPGMVNLGYAAASLAFLYTQRNLCLALLCYPVGERAVSWRSEVWPFQWKIAVSCACAYFTIQIFTPVLFAYRGPAEAGQFGLSLSIATYLSALVIAWMSTKAAPFAQMIARGELQRLRRLFFRTLWQSLVVLVGISAACEAGAIALQHLFPRLADRMASPQVFAILLLTSASAFIVQSIAIYLRSFKREPFLTQSIAVAVSTVTLALPVAKTWSVVGVAFSYLVCTGALGLVYAMVVFRRDRHHSAWFMEGHMLRAVLRFGRFTKYLPYVRGLGALRDFYELVLPKRELQLRVDDFDDDLRMDVDVREIIGINVWHRPELFEKHERRMFCAAITPGSVVLDVGANVGIYTLLAAKRGARVIAVEADPSNIEILRHHVHLNGFDDRVTILHMAASDTDRALTLFRSPGNSGHSNLFEGVKSVLIPGKTIDSLGLPPIDVCKMDIEGAEMMALSGMQDTISRSPRMSLLVEYNTSLGQTNGMMEFICEHFPSVYAIQKPPFRARGPLAPTQKPRSFCNLWASKLASDLSNA